MKKEKLKILFFDSKPYDIESFERENNAFGFELKFFKSHLTIDTAELSKGFESICLFVNDIVTKKVADILVKNGVKLIALRSAGYNNIDLKAVYKKINVVRVPAYSPHGVAEHAVALMLALNRKTYRAYYRVRDNNFAINGLMGFDMYGKTCGVIGTGKIGRVLIQLLRGFGMTVLAHDPYPDKEFEKTGLCEYAPLSELYRRSDIISLHCPLTRDTYHIVNKRSISKMKEGVMIINTGRGKLIDTKALIAGLKSAKVGYAGLDVYEEESEYFFEDLSGQVITDDVLSRLLTFPNVVITSHQGFFTKEAMRNIAITTLDNIKEFFDKGKVKNEVSYRTLKNA